MALKHPTNASLAALCTGIGLDTNAYFDSAPAGPAVGTVPVVERIGIGAPVAGNTSTATTGGTLAAATYYYVVCALFGTEVSPPSAEKSQATTGATSTVTLALTPVAGATGYRLYRGTVSGTYTAYQDFTGGSLTSVTDAGAAGTAGTLETHAFRADGLTNKRIKLLQTSGSVANGGVVTAGWTNRTGVTVPSGKYLWAVEA